MPRKRADLLIVARGLAESRARAQAAIIAGGVTADGAPVTQASQLLDENATLVLNSQHPWVSRAGMKLAYALEAFGVSPAGVPCLDIGSSTGGFTEVLLAHGAAHVTAVDVGRDQMHRSLRGDTRVTLLEGCDARTLSMRNLKEPPHFIVCDASFIGLEKILPAPLSLAAPNATLVALVKPQFESGPRRGALLSPAAAFQIAEAVAHRLDGVQNFVVRRLVASPVTGGDGAPEFLLHASRP